MLKNEFPEAHIIKGDGNLWWTGATNLGVKYALENGAEFILTLNNDTVAAEDFLEKMVYWSNIKPNSLLGALLINILNNKPLYGGEIGDWKTLSGISLLNILKEEEMNGIHRVTQFPGRGLLIPSQVFKKIGLYDSDNFPHYSADEDFTQRAYRAGYEIFCNYDSKIYSYPDGKNNLPGKYSLKNYYYYLFNIKGRGNLRNYSLFAIKNCPKRFLLKALIIGNARRILGYLYEWYKYQKEFQK
jgi:GT2 family glycosyltransferase